MSIQATLQKEIEDSKMWHDMVKEDNTHKRDLRKRIELINFSYSATLALFSLDRNLI